MYIQALPPLSCGEAIKTCFKKYCTFTGRARRSEYWYFSLFLSIISIIPVTLYIILIVNLFKESGKNYNNNYNNKREDPITGGNLALLLTTFFFEFFIIFSLLAVGARRLHDVDKSGCCLFLSCFPCGIIFLLIFFVEDSHQYANEYGPSPKYVQLQNSPLIVNQQNPVNVMVAPNYQIPQGYPQVNPYPQYSQAPIQNNLYQGPIQVYPSNQEQIATPMVSP